MSTPVFNYVEQHDAMYFSFFPGEDAMAIDLSEHISLRLNKKRRRAIGLTFHDFSLLAEETEGEPRDLPLTGMEKLPDELRKVVLDILHRPPVSEILSCPNDTPSSAETVPVTSLQPEILAAT